MITSSTSVGNFRRMKLKKEVGLWELRVVSNSAYTVKIVGENFKLKTLRTGNDNLNIYMG